MVARDTSDLLRATVAEDTCALHAHKHPHHDHEAVDNLRGNVTWSVCPAKVVGKVAPEVSREDIEAEDEDHRGDKHKDGDKLANHHDDV